MLKELIKMANRLDKLGLIREADYLDEIIKSASDNPMDLGSDMDISLEKSEPQPFSLNPFKNFLLEETLENIKDIFKESCNERINEARVNIFKDPDLNISLLHPRYSSFNIDELEEIYGEGPVREFDEFSQEYNPEDLVAAAESILDDKSGRYPKSKTDKVKSLLRFFNNFMDNLFVDIKT
jgi:hypothetical protein